MESNGENLSKRQFARAVRDLERITRQIAGRYIDKGVPLTWRLLHAPPQPYTRERFDDTYRWTVKWNMTVPGATYENTVDNRAWE